MDFSKFSDADLLAISNNDLSKVSDRGLKSIVEQDKLEKELALIKPDTGFTGAFKAGKERLIGDTAALLGRIGIRDVEAAEETKARRDKIAERVFQPTQESFSEAPFLKTRELLGGSLPYVAAPLVAGIGAATLPVSAPVSAGIGLVGAGLASLGQFTGSNLSRQMQEDPKLRLAETNLGAATAAAAPQAALDIVSFRMIPGIGKIFGAAGKEITPEIAKKIAEQGILKTTGAYGAGAVKTAGIEGTTEAGQQFFERLQAGLNLTDEKARDEYFDSFIGGAVLGGTLSVPGTFIERGQTIRKGAEMEKEQQQKAIVDRQNAQKEAFLEKQRQLQQTSENLGVSSVLALPAPEQRIELEEVVDPLIDPLGRFKSTDLSAKEVATVNKRRTEMGKPRIGKTFSIEDLADVFKPDETVAAEGVLGRLIASRTGYTAGQDIPAQTLNAAAQQRGIDTTTQGFKEFLTRTTGVDDVNLMSPPQRLAVAQAIQNVKAGDETRILESGLTNAKYYTADQYNDTIKGLSKEFKEMGNQENGISSVLKQIEKYSGLKQEKDQRRLLEQAVKDGVLERDIKLSSTGSTIETFKPATELQPLPGGMDIRKETFKQGEVPGSYDLKAGARVLSSRETQEEADRDATAFEQKRQNEVVRIEREVQKLQKAIAARNAELTNMQALGQEESNEFFIKSASNFAQDQTANATIADLRQEQQGFADPVQVVPVGTKPVTKDSFTYFEKDEPQVRFDTEEQAEQYGISRLNDETLQQIIDSAASQKQTGRVKRYTDLAEKELNERQSIETDRGIAVTTTKGLKGSKERLEALGIFSKEVQDNVEKLRQTLLPALKRLGLEKVGLRLVDSIENGTADGFYVQQVITVAMDSKNPMGTLRHEAIHALKELDAFTAQEWKVLTNKAKSEYVQKYIKDTNLYDSYKNKYKEDNGNLTGFDEYIYEEAIAEAFSDFKAGKLPAGMIGNIWVRLNKLFEVLRNGFSKLGFQTSEDIFTKVEEGRAKPTKVVAEKPDTEEKPARLSFKSPKKDIEPLDVQQARIYERELEALIKKVGSRIAGMKSEETLADVKKAVKKLQDYTAQGLKGKDWYEKSAKAVLSAFDDNTVLAEKFFQVIAITSANTEVAANFTKAANAWTQFTEGRPIKVGTENENKKIGALLNFGEEWEGRKTNTFYSNLMEAMEGKDSGRSTIDLHMTRMIFGKDTPTDAQYELAENMVRLLASKVNLAPRQVQAASWVTQKAKTMFNDYRKKGWKKDLTDAELSQFAFERAVADYSYQMNKRVANLPITEKLREPSEDIKARVQNITGEVIPSVQTNMSQAESLAFKAKEDLTKEIANSDTVQSIANTLGIISKIRITVGSGAYANTVNPNLIVQIVNDDAKVAEKDASDMANAMSYVFKQDATPLFKADPKLIESGQLGYKIKFDKATVTPAQQKKMLAVLQGKFGEDAGFTRIRGNELVTINFRGEDGKPFLVTDEEFTQGLADISDALSEISPIESQEFFGATSEYNYHDWKEKPSGTSLISGIQSSRSERPNIQRGLDNLRESFIDSVRSAVKKSGQEPRFSLRKGIAAPDTKEFKEFFKGSKVVNEDGSPKVMYHGTARDITEFKPKQADAIFLTEDPAFANSFANSSIDYIVYETFQSLPFETQEEVIKDAVNLAVKNKTLNKGDARFATQTALTGGNLNKYGIQFHLKKFMRPYLTTGENIIPVFVKSKKPFDYEKYDVDGLNDLLNKDDSISDIDIKAISNGNWKTIESPKVQERLKSLGFDGFYVKESFNKNLAVYNPNQVKSVFNEKPTESPDIRYALREFSMNDLPKSDDYTIKAGTKIFHGAYESMADLIEKASRSLLPPNKDRPKASNGALYEGNLIWFSDKDTSERYAKSESDPMKVKSDRDAGVVRNEGKVFSTVTDKPLKLLNYNRHELTQAEADKLNKVLGMPDYKSLQAGDTAYSAAYRGHTNGKNVKRFTVKNSAEFSDSLAMVAKTLGYDGIFDTSGIALTVENGIRLGDESTPMQRFSLRSQVSDRLNDRIAATTTKRKEAGFVERIVDSMSPTAFTKLRQAFINKYESIERLSNFRGAQLGSDQLLADNSAIAAALQSDRAAGIAASSFRDGIPVYDKGYTYVSDMDGEAKGLITILEPLMTYRDPYIFQMFQYYAGTRRGRRLDAEGREKTFTKEDIDAGKDLEKQFPEFATVFEDYQKYNAGLVKYMMDTGVISPAEAKVWTQNWDYIPFYRQIDGEKTAGPKVFSSISGVAKPKKLKGSEAPLDDFMETIVRNARAAIEAGMKNEAARRVIRDVVDFGLGEKLAGVQAGNDVVTLKENGNTVYYRVADPLLVESLKGLNLPQLPFMSFLSAPANLLRNFVTKDPGFILANLGRDSMQAWITSGTNMTPLVDSFKQFGKGLLNYSPEAFALARAGLTGYDFAGDVESTAKKVEQELRKRTGTRTKKEIALLPITAFWNGLEKASNASDMATRAEVYKRTLERTGSEAEAFFQAMEVMNFSRNGNSALVRILSATIPFFNARVQGLDVLYRTGFGKAAMANKETIQKAFIFRSLVLLGTSVMYWSMVSDDEDYKKLSEEERDNYWIIPALRVGDKPFRFPIPFELGVLFKVLPERALEYSFGTDTGKDLRKSLTRNAMSTLSFNPIPQAVLPIVENVTNYSFFTGESVVGRGVEGLAPAFQFGAGTSVLAKQMGEALNYSPQKIDNFIRGYTGTLGTYAMMMLDSALAQEGDPARATKRMEQLPVIKRFFAGNTGTVSAYYDMKDEVDTVVRTVNMLQRTGNSEDLKEYLEENKKLYSLKGYVATLDKSMKQLNQATRLINASKTMDADAKREALDKINDAKIKLTERTKILRKGYE